MKKFYLLAIIMIALLLTGCSLKQTNNANQSPKAVNQASEAVNSPETENADCVKIQDLPNEYGCHPSMACDEGEVCREGMCVDATDAPDKFGCHPSMTCDQGEVCRNGICVDEADAPDAFGCHPSMICDEGEVCREGVCYKVCK